MKSAAQQRIEAWNRYKGDTCRLKLSDWNYQSLERKAWNKLQATLKAIR